MQPEEKPVKSLIDPGLFPNLVQCWRIGLTPHGRQSATGFGWTFGQPSEGNRQSEIKINMSGTDKLPVNQKTDGFPTGTNVAQFRSRDQRIAAGKTLRDTVPRQSHAGWEPPASRRDPMEILKESNQDRMAELVPIRYGGMPPSPFTFLRGSADSWLPTWPPPPPPGYGFRPAGIVTCSTSACSPPPNAT